MPLLNDIIKLDHPSLNPRPSSSIVTHNGRLNYCDVSEMSIYTVDLCLVLLIRQSESIHCKCMCFAYTFVQLAIEFFKIAARAFRYSVVAVATRFSSLTLNFFLNFTVLVRGYYSQFIG